MGSCKWQGRHHDAEKRINVQRVLSCITGSSFAVKALGREIFSNGLSRYA